MKENIRIENKEEKNRENRKKGYDPSTMTSSSSSFTSVFLFCSWAFVLTIPA